MVQRWMNETKFGESLANHYIVMHMEMQGKEQYRRHYDSKLSVWLICQLKRLMVNDMYNLA